MKTPPPSQESDELLRAFLREMQGVLAEYRVHLPEGLTYVVTAITSYLLDGGSLDNAFAVKAKVGRPKKRPTAIDLKIAQKVIDQQPKKKRRDEGWGSKAWQPLANSIGEEFGDVPEATKTLEEARSLARHFDRHGVRALVEEYNRLHPVKRPGKRRKDPD